MLMRPAKIATRSDIPFPGLFWVRRNGGIVCKIRVALWMTTFRRSGECIPDDRITKFCTGWGMMLDLEGNKDMIAEALSVNC